MEKEGNEKILTIKELTSAVWEKKRQKSVKAAVELDKEYGTEKLEAQEQLLNFILNLGGVREDVYTYLLTPRFDHVSSVLEIRALLCYAAPAAWIELAVEAINRDAISGLLYADEIVEAYKEGIPFEMIQKLYSASETAFDMCRNRARYRVRIEEKELHATVAQSEEESSLVTVTQSEKEEPHATVTQSEQRSSSDRVERKEMSELITGAVMAAMQEFIKQSQGEDLNVTQSEKEEPRATVTQSEKEEPHATVTQSEKEEPRATVTQSDEEFDDTIMQSMEDMPDFPDGKELLENHVTAVDLEKEAELYEKRVSFFQMLLNRYMKKTFSKLDEEAQIGKIFEIMVGRKYGKGKILAIRRLMNGGMSKEFIYSLLEKNLSEEELEGLCESLLDNEFPDSEKVEGENADTGQKEAFEALDLEKDK